ncbi:site-2 protease family protein [Nitrosomonas sp.]|uniref:site-2 protease family protein n=1 Tax=Nitrosomonas sp. TaxID=42353 RepID=UPI002621F89E|nr:site-2 protease family protein [Nitrosomonas sp.]
MPAEDVQQLPLLREDLQLLKAPNAYDGSQAWTLYDPLNNRFFRIGVLVYHMLTNWSAGNGQALINRIASGTVFSPTLEDVSALISFLHLNQLTIQSHTQQSANYLAQHKKYYANRFQRFLSQYLFFRVPLFRPDDFLSRTYPFIKKFYSATFLYLATLIGVTGIYLVSRQWDIFVNTFLHFFTLHGALVYAAALIGTKIFHELGHAYTAKHYGCRVSSMGIAFMVMMPMLYSDTSDTWRLHSKQQRMHVAAAGIINELILAGICLFIWAFLPEGILKSTCFVIATTSLISSLVINLTPFMRFDGYYILSDWWGVDNLQQRSFQLAQWKLRQLLFGTVEEKPEQLFPSLEFKLICYAWLTWLYRLTLYLGIALLVYHFFFKLLGLILFIVEIVLLIIMPIYKEIKHWWFLKSEIRHSNRFRLWLACLIISIGSLFFPWNSQVTIPGVLTSASHASIYSPESAQIVSIDIKRGQKVEQDQVLMVLRSPNLESEIALTRKQLEFFNLRAMRAVANRQDQDDLHVILEQIAAESSKLEGLEKRQTRLVLRASFSGVIAEMDDTLRIHQWVNHVTLHSAS